jgi:hypothetical protein
VFDSKPQQSWPTRARDIVGKLHCSTTSLSRLSHQGHKTLQVNCIVGDSCAKGIDGTEQDHAKNCLNRRIFCWESNSMCINLNTKVDAIGHYHVQKSNAQEGEVCLVEGAPLKERDKGGASYLLLGQL